MQVLIAKTSNRLGGCTQPLYNLGLAPSDIEFLESTGFAVALLVSLQLFLQVTLTLAFKPRAVFVFALNLNYVIFL